MKMNKFSLGVVAGIAALGLAVPALAQLSSAATGLQASGTEATLRPFTRRVPTQEQVTAMASRDEAFLKNIDAFVTVLKNAKQAHQTALAAAAAIADDAQRAASVQKANDDERAAIQAAVTANPDLKALMPFGGGHGLGFGVKGGPGMMGRATTATLAATLGMTETDLEAVLATGKTIQQIATEKGITLPAPPVDGRGRGMHGGWMKGFRGTASSSASSAQ